MWPTALVASMAWGAWAVAVILAVGPRRESLWRWLVLLLWLLILLRLLVLLWLRGLLPLGIRRPALLVVEKIVQKGAGGPSAVETGRRAEVDGAAAKIATGRDQGRIRRRGPPHASARRGPERRHADRVGAVVAGQGRGRGVESRGQESCVARRTETAGGGGRRRKEEIRLTRCRRWDPCLVRLLLGATGEQCGCGAVHGRRVSLDEAVDMARGSGEGGSLVGGSMLGLRGALDGAMEEASDDAAPNNDCKAECCQNGANSDEDGAVGEGRVVHEGRMLRVGDGGRGVRRDGSGSWPVERGEIADGGHRARLSQRREGEGRGSGCRPGGRAQSDSARRRRYRGRSPTRGGGRCGSGGGLCCRLCKHVAGEQREGGEG